MAKILIVDDNKEVRVLLTVILERSGHEVVEAADEADATRWALDTGPDVIMMDIMMPGTDGWTALEALKAEPRTTDIPVIMLSALGTRDDLMKARRSGAFDYLTKPWSNDSVSQRLNWALASTIAA